MSDYYKIDSIQLYRELNIQERGLSTGEAVERLAQFGPNELRETSGRSPFRILWEQLTATMVIVLIGAAVLSAALGDYKDAAAITIIVLLFAVLGFVQEYRAEKAMLALKQLAVPIVRVHRDHEVKELSAKELVPGDRILLEAGNVIPADCRIIEAKSLKIQEAALTGESEAIEKTSAELPGPDLPLGDRRNMAYMGTIVTYGRGEAVVVQTGMHTELGKIASLIQTVQDEQTPLQQRLDQVGKLLAGVGIAFSAIIFLLGTLRGEAVRDMLLTAVSVAVAIIPEGLPAVVTITLALGAQRMLHRRALIRRLPAVETLGSVTVICSDKTGTLTENRMTVMILDVAGHVLNLTEVMKHAQPVSDMYQVNAELSQTHPPSIPLLLSANALCNDALLKETHETNSVHAIGDPTEGALLIAAAQSGITKERLQEYLPRVSEVPFDSERKRMSTVHALPSHQNEWVSASLPGISALNPDAQKFLVFTKGSVDNLLDISSKVWVDDHVEPMTDSWRKRIETANNSLAQQGMRVLGTSYKFIPQLPSPAETIESDLIFIGLVGMIDPPRAEVKNAVAMCKTAGIRPVMITGDHPLTASQIAKDLGILLGEQVLTGAEINRFTDQELEAQVEKVSVFARVSPEHKLRIVQALQNRGHIVAMTGDGVNDAPALKRANIGVAMGITGTDVSKEAAEIVLQDDNFATIVAAIEEGRTIYDNLRKFVKFSLAGNIGKVMVMLLAPFLGKPLPLLPIQLLWLNLLTDGLLGLGLGMEPPEKGTMQRSPYSSKEGIFSRGAGFQVIWVGGLIGTIALGVGYYYWLHDPNGNWQTMTFSTLAFAQLAQALASRSAHESVFKVGLFTNLTGLSLAFLVFILQIAVLYIPFLQDFFNTQPLPLSDLAISIILSLLVFGAIELEKQILAKMK